MTGKRRSVSRPLHQRTLSMPEKIELERLDPELIDCSGDWLFWSEEPDSSFVRSVQSLGQLEPILVSTDNGRWELISGYKRVRACQKLKTAVTVLHTKIESQMAKGVVYVQLNRTRDIHPVGLVKGMRFFYDHVEPSEFEQTVKQELGPLSSARELHALLAWAGLEDDWDSHLQAGRCPLELGLVLTRMAQADRQAVEPLFGHLAWSKNKAQHLLTWLSEAAVMKKVQVQALIEQAELLDCAASAMSPKDRQEEILARVRAVRYPRLTELEREFEGLEKRVRTSTRWHITPQQHFESNGFVLQAKVKNLQDLQNLSAELQSLEHDDRVQAFFDWQHRALD